MSADPRVWDFNAAVFSWAGDQPGSWRFARLPDDVADELRMTERSGFGSVKVRATIGGSTWETSVFPDKASQSFVLPVKKSVRRAEGIADDDVVAIRLQLS